MQLVSRARRKSSGRGRTQRRATAAAAVAVLIASLLTVFLGLAPTASATGSSCGASINPITCENLQTGTPQSTWDVTGSGDPTIQGFATNISVNAGTAISFKIKTSYTYRIDIYRLGYYAGKGAALKAANLTHATPVAQPTCLSDPSTGLFDCGNWSVSASWTVPSSAVSGVYLARLTRTDAAANAATNASQIPFIVRNDASTADIVYQTSDPTWQAYNRYGGSDFYTGDLNNLFDSPSRARKLSYNRPFATRGDSSGRDFLFSNEYPTIRFMERNGYDVTYIAGVDTDRYGATLLKNHKVFMSVGHDEYWSQAQLNNVTAARNAGVSLMFLSGNEVFWHTRYEASIDGSNTAYRTLVCYKETWDNAATDPTGEATATYRDPRFGAAPGGSQPENSLTGTLYMANSVDLPITVTQSQGKLRMWRNTALASMSTASTALAPHTIGYESDEDLDNGFRPAGEIDASTTTGPSPNELADFGQYTVSSTTTHHLTLYRAASGALVFGAGTIQWGWGLDANHDGTAGAADVRMQQAMINLLADMKVTSPQTLMSGLVSATASTDKTAPTSQITSPVSNASVANGTTLTVTGTASDVGGVVAGVEVSIDGGVTWHPASGTTSWSYTGTVFGNGTTTILSRATDDSLNTETPSAGVSLTTSCPCTLLGTRTPTTVDSGDTYPTELGVRFTTDTAGYISGVRFYKSAANTGVHTGSLWTTAGVQLATGTFSNETASGWQTLTFTNPIAVAANTTYVASYYAPAGHYSEDDRVFYYKSYDAPPLHAEATSIDGTKYNGLWAIGDKFPANTYGGANYWVDPVFSTSGVAAPTVTSTTPAANATGVPISAVPSATFSTAMTGSSVTETVKTAAGATVSGTASYNATTNQVSFTPAGSFSPSTTYTVTVNGSGSTGLPMTQYSWSFTTAAAAINCPCTLFAAAATPGTVDSGDRSALTVGVKFSSNVAGYVSGVRFYKSAANTGTHTASLWSSTGGQLATGTFAGESASGWQSLNFASPVAITPGVTYVVSYYAPAGHYSEDDGYFSTAVSNGPLSAPVTAGVYTYGADTFPTSSYQNANYWIDPIFSTSGASAPSISATTPTAAQTSVSTGVAPTATFSMPMNAATVTATMSSNGATVSGTASYNAGSNTVTFTPTAALAYSTSYTMTVGGTATAGPAMAPYSWSFTTTAAPVTCPCTLFAAAATPSGVDSGDGTANSLGMKFSPSADGQITGIRFYKSAANTGTHTGSLWSSTGTLLATGTFSNETASGWQTLTFATPVAVTAGTTYVASYFAPAGHYSEDDGYFAAAATNGPLTAPAGAGVYLYASDGFPSSTWANANYWVDPVFVSS